MLMRYAAAAMLMPLFLLIFCRHDDDADADHAFSPIFGAVILRVSYCCFRCYAAIRRCHFDALLIDDAFSVLIAAAMPAFSLSLSHFSDDIDYYATLITPLSRRCCCMRREAAAAAPMIRQRFLRCYFTPCRAAPPCLHTRHAAAAQRCRCFAHADCRLRCCCRYAMLYATCAVPNVT